MKKKVFLKFVEYFWIFLLGSVVGFVYENLLMWSRGNWHLRQGLIYGPFIPVYGVGLLVFYIIAKKQNIDKQVNKLTLLKIFLVASFLGGLVEYIFSYLQEEIWGTISWNYVNKPLNINGRTSIPIAILWGLGFVIFSLYVFPHLRKHNENIINNKSLHIITIVCSILVMLDCTISFAATYRQKERKDNIKPSNHIEVILDKYYPDKYLDGIYNNAVAVKVKK